MNIETFEQYQTEAMKTLSHEFHLIIQPELIHAVIGIVTEVTEMKEALQDLTDFDSVNFAEEIGDALWFVAVACHYLDISPNNLPFGGQTLHVVQKRGDMDVIVEMTEEMMIQAGNALDIVKKSMFYNRAINQHQIETIILNCGATLLMMCDWLDVTPSKVTTTNINKLKKRFPDKFDSASANTRNLEAERNELEAGLGNDNRVNAGEAP